MRKTVLPIMLMLTLAGGGCGGWQKANSPARPGEPTPVGQMVSGGVKAVANPGNIGAWVEFAMGAGATVAALFGTRTAVRHVKKRRKEKADGVHVAK